MADDSPIEGPEPGETIEDVGVDPDAPAPLALDPDSPNLAIDLAETEEGKALLKKIGNRVIRDFDSAFDSTEEYRDRCAKNWVLFSGDLPPKTVPWEGCANMHVPIFLKHTSRIVSRIMAEVYGDWQNFHSYEPVMPWSEPARMVAQQLTIHSNWQFRTQIADFQRQMERGCLAFIAFGDATCHSYYDEETWRNRHEICTPDDFVIPYTYVTTQPDYSDVPYRCKILRYHRHQIQAMRDKWYDIDELLDDVAADDDEPEAKLRDGIAQASGQEKPDENKHAPRKIILYEGWCEILSEHLPVDRDYFMQVYVDYKTKHVLKVTIHEEDDWKDTQRFQQQEAELQRYDEAQQQYAMMQQQVAAMAAQPDMGLGVMPGMMPPPVPELPPPPEPPAWLDETGVPAPVRRVPINMFTHCVDIENLLGSLGIGHGRILADINRAANTTLNQYIDSASMGNGAPWFSSLRLKGPIKWGPQHVNELEGHSAEEISKGLVQMPTRPANPQMLDLVEKADEWGEDAMQAGSVLAGDPGKSGETWRGHSARIEQATKQLSVTARKWALFTKQIIEKNGKLNSMFLPEHEVMWVSDRLEGAAQIEVTREMYAMQHFVEIKSDLRFATQAQKVGEADEVVKMIMALPPLQQNPAIVHAAIKNAFLARGLYDMARRLGPEPPPGVIAPPVPPGGAPGQPTPGAPPGATPQAARPPGPPQRPPPGRPGPQRPPPGMVPR